LIVVRHHFKHSDALTHGMNRVYQNLSQILRKTNEMIQLCLQPFSGFYKCETERWVE
jgi:glycine cleavage system protein P-like pyridoxal-binding family